VVLFDIEGLSYEEIAAIEGVPLGTVKSRLSRGRDHLKRVLMARRTSRAMPVVPTPIEPERSGNLTALGLVKRERKQAP
jgi:hypothetical protein